MEQRKITVTAVGQSRLDILGRITALYLQRNIPVESLALEQDEQGCGWYRICARTNEESIIRIVNQIHNIVDIIKVEYSYN